MVDPDLVVEQAGHPGGVWKDFSQPVRQPGWRGISAGPVTGCCISRPELRGSIPYSMNNLGHAYERVRSLCGRKGYESDDKGMFMVRDETSGQSRAISPTNSADQGEWISEKRLRLS